MASSVLKPPIYSRTRDFGQLKLTSELGYRDLSRMVGDIMLFYRIMGHVLSAFNGQAGTPIGPQQAAGRRS